MISIELIPRDKESLEKDVRLVKENLSSVDAINIPDLLAFDLRSWEGASLTMRYFPYSIPHLRAIDFSLDAPARSGTSSGTSSFERLYCNGGIFLRSKRGSPKYLRAS